LCTGNICRSPIGERLLQRRLDERGVEATVSSAGFLTEGQPAADESIELLHTRGIDARDHRSRLTTPELLARSDLVLGMARQHVRESVVLDRDVMAKVFTLRELARRGTEAGRRRPDETLEYWLRRCGSDRSPASLMGSSDEDDIADPVGRRFGVHKKVATQIDEAITRLVDLAWPVGTLG
jgi:protein-tyrosine phosphatase